MNTDASSIEGLPEPLQNVSEYLEKNYTDDIIQLVSGAEDVLVIVSKSEGPSPEFQNAVGDAVVNGTGTPCGFVLDDGPEGYEERTTAYARAEPVNAYEFILPYCAAVGATAQEAARVFGETYDKAGDEGPEDAPRIAAAYIYILRPDYGSGDYLETLADLADVSPGKLRTTVADVQTTL